MDFLTKQLSSRETESSLSDDRNKWRGTDQIHNHQLDKSRARLKQRIILSKISTGMKRCKNLDLRRRRLVELKQGLSQRSSARSCFYLFSISLHSPYLSPQFPDLQPPRAPLFCLILLFPYHLLHQILWFIALYIPLHPSLSHLNSF